MADAESRLRISTEAGVTRVEFIDRNILDEANIQAIGDEINDLGMIESAGLGVAMANAADAVKAVADCHTGHHNEGGAGEAIMRIVDGEW